MGLGVSAGYDFSKSLSIRGQFNQFDYGFDATESGNKYDGDLELQSLGITLDWHPFDSGFRVTGGAFLNNNALAVSTVDADNLDIDGVTYAGNLELDVDFERIAPYLGIGWSGGRDRSGFSFVFDAGLLFQRTPHLMASGRIGFTGSACSFEVSEDGAAMLSGGGCALFDTLESDLENEHEDLTDELDDYKLYPVVLLGISYRF